MGRLVISNGMSFPPCMASWLSELMGRVISYLSHEPNHLITVVYHPVTLHPRPVPRSPISSVHPTSNSAIRSIPRERATSYWCIISTRLTIALRRRFAASFGPIPGPFIPASSSIRVRCANSSTKFPSAL